MNVVETINLSLPNYVAPGDLGSNHGPRAGRLTQVMQIYNTQYATTLHRRPYANTHSFGSAISHCKGEILALIDRNSGLGMPAPGPVVVGQQQYLFIIVPPPPPPPTQQPAQPAQPALALAPARAPGPRTPLPSSRPRPATGAPAHQEEEEGEDETEDEDDEMEEEEEEDGGEGADLRLLRFFGFSPFGNFFPRD